MDDKTAFVKWMVADFIINRDDDWKDKIGDEQFFNGVADATKIVWFCKTLQNWKCLAINFEYAPYNYFEITHNGDKTETYLDAYAKTANKVYRG